MCTNADHDAVKRDPIRWSALEPIGVQVLEADEVNPRETLELRNCVCGSTLALVTR